MTVGIVFPGGAAILGEPLSKSEFIRLPMAAQGNEVVDYCAGSGLLFAVPVIRDGLIHAIVYRLSSESLPIVEGFKAVRERLTNHRAAPSAARAQSSK